MGDPRPLEIDETALQVSVKLPDRLYRFLTHPYGAGTGINRESAGHVPPRSVLRANPRHEAAKAHELAQLLLLLSRRQRRFVQTQKG